MNPNLTKKLLFSLFVLFCVLNYYSVSSTCFDRNSSLFPSYPPVGDHIKWTQHVRISCIENHDVNMSTANIRSLNFQMACIFWNFFMNSSLGIFIHRTSNDIRRYGHGHCRVFKLKKTFLWFWFHTYTVIG